MLSESAEDRAGSKFARSSLTAPSVVSCLNTSERPKSAMFKPGRGAAYRRDLLAVDKRLQPGFCIASQKRKIIGQEIFI